MQKTTNYQLSQWDAEDRILREDFNQDNKKLDDAIAALRDASPLVKLLDFTTQSSQSKVEISLADLDLRNYRELWMYITFSSTTTETNFVYLTLNDIKQYWDSSTSTQYGLVTISTRGDTAGRFIACVTILMGPLIAGYIRQSYYTEKFYPTIFSNMQTAALSGDQLTKMALCCLNGTIGAGSRITILGVRI